MGGAARRRASSAVSVAAAMMAVVMLAGTASAAVYEVGDKAGWTVMGNPDYGAWAASKKFHVGDTVVFTYLKQFHNVMAVSNASYSSCNASKPLATWNTGNDSVALNTTGHHYFLCGVLGHCAAGQKVDINVLSSSAAPSVSPSVAPTPAGSSSGGASAAPSPHGNAAAPTTKTVGGGSKALLAASVLSVVAAVLA